MGFTFVEATKEKAKARIALVGISGSGKTYTALTLAREFGGPIALVDSERGSASKYSGKNGFKFKVLDLERFDPRKVPELIQAAIPICGEGTLILDSFSAWWSGPGGMQELVDAIAGASKSGNSFQAWGKARPYEKAMFDAILTFPGHVIVTMRAKTEYTIDEGPNGKKTPRKLGMAPDQRANVEYEFDLVGDMDNDNVLTVSKSRCTPIRERGRFPHPGKELADMMLGWLNDGADPAPRASKSAAVIESERASEPDLSPELAVSEAADRMAKAQSMGELQEAFADAYKHFPKLTQDQREKVTALKDARKAEFANADAAQ